MEVNIYITDKYIFIHQNKTGGVFVKDWMIENMNAKVLKYKHSPVRMVPDKYRKDHEIIGIVRNPLPWYVSYYSYHHQNGRFLGVPFEQYLKTHTTAPRALLSLMPKKIRKKYPLCYPPRTTLPIGGWTYHFINYFSNNAFDIFKNWDKDKFERCYPWGFPEGEEKELNNVHVDHLLRQHILRKEMIKVFGDQHTGIIMKFKKRNTSKHKGYRKFYTPELRKLVEQRDGILMEALGYEF